MPASGACPTRFGKNFFDEDRLGVCIGFPVGVMHDRKMPLEVIIALRFVGVGSEIVPEGQVQPLLSGWLSDVNMVRPASPVRRHPLNRGEAIADHGCAALDDTADKSGDAFRGEVAQRFEPDPAWMAFLGQLYCTDDQKLADVASALAACDGIVLRAVRDLGLIHLDKVEEGRALGIDHSPAKLLKHEPGGLVAAEAELSLELEGLAKFRLFQQYPPIPERRSLDFIRQPNVRKRVQAV